MGMLNGARFFLERRGFGSSQQFEYEGTARVTGVVTQIAAKGSHKRARQIQTEAGRIRSLLQRLK
jgi:hypothetical protein